MPASTSLSGAESELKGSNYVVLADTDMDSVAQNCVFASSMGKKTGPVGPGWCCRAGLETLHAVFQASSGIDSPLHGVERMQTIHQRAHKIRRVVAVFPSKISMRSERGIIFKFHV